jgi:hypothetical protein
LGFAAATLAAVGGFAFLASCGSDSDPTDSAGNTAAITAAASVGGSVQGSDTSVSQYVPQPKPSWFDTFGTDLFGIPIAEAAICTPGAVYSACSSGVITATFDGCTGPFNVVEYNDNFTATVFNSSGSVACPTGTGGFWTRFFESGGSSSPGDSLWKQFTSGASDTNTVDNIVVTFNNQNPTGWDSGVTLTPASSTTPTYSGYGVYRAVTSWNSGTNLSMQTLMNYGIEYVATGTSKKGKKVTVWDHTISYSGTGLTVQHTFGGGTDTKVVNTATNSVVIVQHNLAKWTGKSTISGLTFVHGGTAPCGCFPTAGTIDTTYTGSKTGYEQVVFNAGSNNASCGAYTLTTTDSTFTALPGTTPTTGVLHHCL